MVFTDEFLRNSVLVVAHPDDEILWFSSILERIGKIIFCFLGNPGIPGRREARLRIIERYPLNNLVCLGLDVSPTFRQADWLRPEEYEAGLRVAHGESDYLRNYQQLKQLLLEGLQGYKNVFTHNPWGEYGHEEHVQVSRVIRQLSGEIQFRVWFSNYASPRSALLAGRYIFGRYSNWITVKTNPDIALQIKKLYVEEDCWTAPDNFCWFPEECFAHLPDIGNSTASSPRNLFPLNFLSW